MILIVAIIALLVVWLFALTLCAGAAVTSRDIERRERELEAHDYPLSE